MKSPTYRPIPVHPTPPLFGPKDWFSIWNLGPPIRQTNPRATAHLDWAASLSGLDSGPGRDGDRQARCGSRVVRSTARWPKKRACPLLHRPAKIRIQKVFVIVRGINRPALPVRLCEIAANELLRFNSHASPVEFIRSALRDFVGKRTSSLRTPGRCRSSSKSSLFGFAHVGC